jgi:hypothetical protein
VDLPSRVANAGPATASTNAKATSIEERLIVLSNSAIQSSKECTRNANEMNMQEKDGKSRVKKAGALLKQTNDEEESTWESCLELLLLTRQTNLSRQMPCKSAKT